MKTSEIMKAWGRILQGRAPSLSIEVTKECPLRCPGCYAYDDHHLGGSTNLRQLHDYKGQELVDKILATVAELKPLHVSLVGGDPLVRHREMETVVPLLIERGVHVQLVTSAFRQIPPAWATMDKLNLVVSIDGLQPEHDKRRAPATYDRILKSIAGSRITIHSTITAQMMQRPGYLQEFMDFWAPRPEIRKVWFSIFTPQIGDDLPEMLSQAEREDAVRQLLEIRAKYPKLDMAPALIREFLKPPQSPKDCIFSQTTTTISADFETVIEPCQFGGQPDCASCGCIASMGLAAIGSHRLGGFVSVGGLFKGSIAIGNLVSGLRGESKPAPRQPADLVATILPARPPASSGSD